MIRSVLVTLSLLSLASPVAAQPRFELFTAYPIPAREVSGRFSTDYRPTLVYDDDATGRATQTLTLDGGRPRGFLAGINWMATPHVGVQIFVNRSSHVVGGTNPATQTELTFVSQPPPDYTPREVTVTRTTEWPDTEGDLTLWRVAGNGLWRFEASRLDVTLTGGVLVSRFDGYFDRASYVEFHLGGHSTLFSEEALARLRFNDDWHVTYNLGADISIPVTRRLALTGGVRLMPLPAAVAVQAEVLNADQMVFTIPESQVRQHIGTQPARFAHRHSPAFAIGLRWWLY